MPAHFILNVDDYVFTSTPAVARSLSFGNTVAYPTPPSAARPNAEAGPSKLPLEESPSIARRSLRSASAQAADESGGMGILETIKERILSLMRGWPRREESDTTQVEAENQAPEPATIEGVVNLVCWLPPPTWVSTDPTNSS